MIDERELIALTYKIKDLYNNGSIETFNYRAYMALVKKHCNQNGYSLNTTDMEITKKQ